MRFPATVVADLTNRCNLRCRYCCFFSNPAECGGSEMSTEAWLKLIAQAGACGVMRMVLRGGEALLRDDLQELILAVVKNRMRFTILTNAISMTPEIASFLASTKRCDAVKISLDGFQETHDAARGAGSHARALRGIGMVREAGLPLIVTCCLHRKNLDRFEEMGEYLLGELKLPTVTFSAVRRCEAGAEWELGAAEIGRALTSLAKLQKRYPGQLANRGLMGTLNYFRRLLKGEGVGCKFCGCDAALSVIKVQADGVCTVSFDCDDSAVVGKFGEMTLAEVWERSTALREKLEAGRSPAEFPAECGSCPFAAHCAGSCPAFFDGHPWESPTCLRRFLTVAKASDLD